LLLFLLLLLVYSKERCCSQRCCFQGHGSQNPFASILSITCTLETVSYGFLQGEHPSPATGTFFTGFKLGEKPLNSSRVGFSRLRLGPQQFIEQTSIDIHRHPFGPFRRVGYPRYSGAGEPLRNWAEALAYLVDAPQSSLLRSLFVPACIDEPVAVPGMGSVRTFV